MLTKTPCIKTIVEVCHVSKATAYRWKRDPDTMPEGYKRLLELHMTGRIIPAKWAGFYFDNDRLWTPIDKGLQAHEAAQVAFFMNFYRTTLAENDQLREYIEYLESVTPRAPVIPFPVDRARRSATADKEFNRLFNKSL